MPAARRLPILPARRRFRRKFVAAWLGMFVALAAAASAAPRVEWRIEVKEDARTEPHSTVDLVINDRQVVHVVAPTEVSKYSVVPREEYGVHDVPAKALCACTSWWAGAGTDYYVAAGSGGRLNLFRRDLDESAGIERYRKDRTIRIASP